ncbi:MAG: hypothetical protein PHF44_03715 [Candidatus Pacebacteria bacterium]|nr:hypothetical protein [Candidatus Paceibacterota bacterium]
MKKIKVFFQKISEKTNLFIKKIIRVVRHIFKQGNIALWVLDGLIVVLIVVMVINIFGGIKKSDNTEYYPSPCPSPEALSGDFSETSFPRGAAVGEPSDMGWKTLSSFGGVGSGKNSIEINPKINWRMVLETKTISKETSTLSLFVYRKEYPQAPVEKFTKELEDRGDGKGRATDIIEICDTAGGDFVIEVKSNNFDWNVNIETLEN